MSIADKLHTIAHNMQEVYEAGYTKGVSEGGGGAEVILQHKYVTPSKDVQEIEADEGYTALEKVIVEPIPDEYVDPSDLWQRKTVTPTKSTQLVWADGNMILERVEVEPIPDEYIIPSGSLPITGNGTYDVGQYKSVNVNVESGGVDDTEAQDLADIIMNDIENFESHRITKLGKYALAYKTNLKAISLPNLVTSAERAFANCDSLTSLSIPNMRGSTQTYMAAYCSAMTSCDVKNASGVSTYSFYGCSNLTKIEFNRVTSINANAFANCSKLATLILRSETMATLSNTNAFTSTKIAGSGGYIYVPSALIDEYKGATNWSTYASKFKSIEGSAYE